MSARQIKAEINRLEIVRARMAMRHATPIEILPVTIKIDKLRQKLAEFEGNSR